MTDDQLKIISDNEQDRANAERWWRENSPEAKCAVWSIIQGETENPVLEVVLRFAQLAFGEMMEKHGP